jgi:hypothetical protein
VNFRWTANSPFHLIEKGHTEMGATKDIREAVQAELTFDPLGGHVRTRAEHDAVVGAGWMAGGVARVRDDLDVTG